jgi:glycerate dehydrogenase
MKIIITDGYPLASNDLNWSAWEKYGEVIVYDFTPKELIVERVKDADILIVNKTPITAETIAACKKLKYIGVVATGYNNVDVTAARAWNIPVCNVAGYGAPSVAQHVFALILALTNRVGEHNTLVQAGNWGVQPHFCFSTQTLIELKDKTLGIYGFGAIGQAVAKIGRGFGMKIIATKRGITEGGKFKGAKVVSFENLLKQSDFLSINSAMSPENTGIFNKNVFKTMKPTAFLINTARGGLIIEEDLKWALENNIIAGAGLDVLTVEPPKTPPFGGLGGLNCIITPHHAWATFEARQRLMSKALENLKAFLRGKPRNVVN